MIAPRNPPCVRSLLSLAVVLVASLAACGSKREPAPAPGSASAPAGSSAPAPQGSAGSKEALTAIAEGAACPAGLRLINDVPIVIDATTAHFTRDRGGGCPTRATYTLIYTKSNPTELRVCEDIGADKCEMMIVGEKVSFDLTPVFKASGAASAVLGK